jgi:hypothetical protein
LTKPVYIVDIFRDVVSLVTGKLLPTLQAVEPLITMVRYDYGHINDINERILARQQNGDVMNPMVLLIEDYKTVHGDEGLTGISNVKIIIVYLSKADITRQQREDNVFRPILYPIYFEFLNQLKVSGMFQIYDVTKIQHEQINRPHWGDPYLYGNKEYPLKGVFDGIELNFTELKTYLDNCL